jgi:hypothetical protein
MKVVSSSVVSTRVVIEWQQTIAGAFRRWRRGRVVAIKPEGKIFFLGRGRIRLVAGGFFCEHGGLEETVISFEYLCPKCGHEVEV